MPPITTDPTLLILAAVLAYLLGSVPFGVVVARIMGLGDLRQIGSGNIGATNVLRTGNKLAAFLTLLFDAGKGAVARLPKGIIILRKHVTNSCIRHAFDDLSGRIRRLVVPEHEFEIAHCLV